jgi:D-beta-D-heptose 7-phosphate kinase/D-beta-D-heptose 1-phosphate adenosyltransferase
LATRKLIGLTGAVAILATRSEKGMSIISAGQALHIPAEAREVFDVSGAGDTVLATFCAALAAKSSLAEAAWVANQASSIVVGKAGTAVVRPEELLAASGQNNPPKVCNLAMAVERVELWRRQGHKVGFTNGCFDLLHPGHISSIRQARAECDKLVIGLNSDSSVQKLKGPTRPVMNEDARATLLAALEDVDCVVIFSEDRPLNLLESLSPDILIKGADYQGKEIPEFEVVRRNGGKVVFAQLEEGFSTTKTIAKMAIPEKV